MRTIAHGDRREADCFIALVDRLLFASTVINYIDRQTLSLLAPYLKIEYQWSNSDYANIAIAFRVAYSIGQTVFGRLMDRIGTRRGLTLTVIWYSLVSMLTFIIAKASTDPVFFFITEWFPIYLVEKGVDYDEKLAGKFPYQRAYLPVNRKLDGTIFNW